MIVKAKLNDWIIEVKDDSYRDKEVEALMSLQIAMNIQIAFQRMKKDSLENKMEYEKQT